MTTNFFYLEVIFIAASVMHMSVSNYGTFVNRHVPMSKLQGPIHMIIEILTFVATLDSRL